MTSDVKNKIALLPRLILPALSYCIYWGQLSYPELFADDSMCNYYATKWKREPIKDHKFSFVNVHDFRDFNIFTEFSYLFVLLSSLRGVVKYGADIWTALVLLNVTTHTFGSLDGLQQFKWVFLASIIFSFLILLWDVRKARRIMISQDIAFAFTDTICYNFYSLKSYSCFCLFHRIENSKNARDFLAFFVFFRLKRWKRLVLAEAPRQIINGYALYSKLFLVKAGSLKFQPSLFKAPPLQKISLVLITISFTIFFISAICVVVALFLYVPLVCQIQGNLKEYVCHKIDKRIGKLIQTKAKNRALENQKKPRKISILNSIRKSSPPSSPIPLIPSPTLPILIMNDDEFKPHPSPTRETHRPDLDSSASWRSRDSPREASFSEYDVSPSTPRGSSSKGSPGEPPHRIENRSNSSSGFYRHPPGSAQRRSYTTPTRISRHLENHPQSYQPPKSAGASSPLQSRTSFTYPDIFPSQHQTKRSIRQPSPIHF